jgi:ATP-dependent helicase Lhr and Lhr-like helicase
MSQAFQRLHPSIQEAIYRQGWDSLRPLQTDAIAAILGTDRHLILSAATASGKTEAAFLPILSRICEERRPSVQAIYISPLKALINDQFGRLEALCEVAKIPVHRWHGDVSATEKKRLREQPGGVLLITPESLESNCTNYHSLLPALYAGLQFVVIDEMHAFLDSVRGVHLLSLLSRLCHKAGCQPRFIGLSATLGDFLPAQAFLDRHKPSAVQVLVEEGELQGKELKVIIKAIPRDSKLAPPEDPEAPEQAQEPISGLGLVAKDLAKRFREGSNLVFVNNRADAELLADELHQIAKAEFWPRDPFVLHHGSLSRELRLEAEEGLRSGAEHTAVCTATLEMGINLGAVKAVAQIRPAWSMASLVQRIGRSGRKADEPQILRLYAMDIPLGKEPTPSQRLFPDLLRSIAMIELRLEKWIEPPPGARCHYSTFVHQIFSVLKQTGGAKAPLIFEQLCARGPFYRVTKTAFASILKSLAEHKLVEQMASGEIILAPRGEGLCSGMEFYAAFSTPVEYAVEWEGRKIGQLQQVAIPEAEAHVLLGGKRWQVLETLHESRRVIVKPAHGHTKPLFLGRPGYIHSRILQTMRDVASGSGEYAYLDAAARENLAQARQAYTDLQLEAEPVQRTTDGVAWFPWEGSAFCQTQIFLARALGVTATWDGLCLHYQKCDLDKFRSLQRELALPSLRQVLRSTLVHADVESERFDEFVPLGLVVDAFLTERLGL